MKLEVRDAEFTDTAESHATISNVAPTVDEITGISMEPTLVGTAIAPNADFSDPGTLDTHTAIWYWDWTDGDQNKSDGTVTETDGSGTVTGSHTYNTPGVYTIRLEVTDDDGGSGSSTLEHYVVIYDPNSGFVTGGGWINSPAGAYPADPELTGKANFGFVSKYKKKDDREEVECGRTKTKAPTTLCMNMRELWAFECKANLYWQGLWSQVLNPSRGRSFFLQALSKQPRDLPRVGLQFADCISEISQRSANHYLFLIPPQVAVSLPAAETAVMFVKSPDAR